MTTIQIVVANRGGARFYEVAPPAASFSALEELRNPNLGTHERDLVSARAGRMRNRAAGRPQTLATRSSARVHAVERFARTIARRIGSQAEEREQDTLILVAERRLLGAIRGYLSKASRARLAATLPLDLVHDATPALRRRLAPVVRQVALESPAAR